MSEVSAIPATAYVAAPGRVDPRAALGALLPEPAASAFTGSDALAEFLASLQKLAEASQELGTTRIHDTQQQLHDELDEYLDKLQEACAKLEQAKQDDGGFFSDCLGFVGDVVGEILGTLTEFQIDAITVPFELGVGLVKNFGDTSAMLQSLQGAGLKLVENGGTAADVKGFTQGVVAFTADVAELGARLTVDVTGALMSGENLGRASAEELRALWGSLERNLLENPHFWAVTSAVAKGAAVAGAVMSGGALAGVALGLMVLMEADQRYGVIQELVGREAAPWVRLSVGVGAALCLGLGATSNSSLVSWLQTGAGALQGGRSVYQGVRAMLDANEQAEQLEQQAELTAQLQLLQRLQRLLDGMLSSLEDDGKSNQKTRELGTSLVQTQVATEAALIVPA